MDMAAPDRYDAITVGETMALFVSHGDPDRFLAAPAGAESNVAMNMARLGCRTRWISRLGDDPLGRLLEDRIAAAGVEVDVVRDASHPTGVMTKHITAGTPIVGYYRSQSAARELSPEDLGRLRPTRWIHVTGITPALSASARELVDAVVERRTPVRARVSFDVNLRPSLWPDTATASDVIGDLARKA
ncbi:MAG TPA: PfkB family carbohydrate kinase, partial [Acidimicrobiia bacterium]|nr:PfkB family carbohydrate kinase [Acidimicrobiia bacterium]